MKTYILEVIKRVKRFSEKFDVSTTLCDKTWVVFNDTGEREVYIFQTDGTVFITSDGVGIKGEWHWVSSNKSLIINKDNNVIMLHPEFVDNTILALTLDGTDEMAFLIDQDNKDAFIAKTLLQLEQYFIEKEQKMIAESNHKVEIEKQKRIETLRQQKKYEKEEEIKKQARELSIKLTQKRDSIILAATILILPLILILLFITNDYKGLAILLLLLAFSILILVLHNKNTNIIEKWKADHPDDPRSKYI